MTNVPRSMEDVSLGRILTVRAELVAFFEEQMEIDPEFRYTFPYDFSGAVYNPGEPRVRGWSRTEAYIWAVMRARDNLSIPQNQVLQVVPDGLDANLDHPRA